MRAQEGVRVDSRDQVSSVRAKDGVRGDRAHDTAQDAAPTHDPHEREESGEDVRAKNESIGSSTRPTSQRTHAGKPRVTHCLAK